MTRILTTASALALALGLAACGPKAEQTADALANSAESTVTAAGDMAANAMDDATTAVMPTPTGKAFADTAAKSDAFEIASAKLASTNAASADVKSFAAEMIKAHTESTAKVAAAASSASPAITPDATLSAEQSADLANLGALKGSAFDEAYVDEQVEAHENALALMRGYAKDGDVPSLKAAAAEIAPVVEKHLGMVKAMDN